MKEQIEIIKNELMEEKERIDEFIEIYDKFENTEKMYYSILIPKEIVRIHDNEIGYGKFNNLADVEEYEIKLRFYKKVAERYNNNDFVLDSDFIEAIDENYEKILDYYISPEVRRRVNGIVDELERSIERLRSFAEYIDDDADKLSV